MGGRPHIPYGSVLRRCEQRRRHRGRSRRPAFPSAQSFGDVAYGNAGRRAPVPTRRLRPAKLARKGRWLWGSLRPARPRVILSGANEVSVVEGSRIAAWRGVAATPPRLTPRAGCLDSFRYAHSAQHDTFSSFDFAPATIPHQRPHAILGDRGERSERPTCHPGRSERTRAESKDPVRAEWRQCIRKHPRLAPREGSPKSHAERARPTAQTVHPATARGPDCASGDSPRPKLCIVRQPAAQTVHLATTSGPKRPLVVAGCTVYLPACRQMHSLARPLSPDEQSVRAACRQVHSLARPMSPGAQFVHAPLSGTQPDQGIRFLLDLIAGLSAASGVEGSPAR